MILMSTHNMGFSLQVLIFCILKVSHTLISGALYQTIFSFKTLRMKVFENIVEKEEDAAISFHAWEVC